MVGFGFRRGLGLPVLGALALVVVGCSGGTANHPHVVGVVRAVPADQLPGGGGDSFVHALQQNGFVQGQNLTLLGENETYTTDATAAAAIRKWQKGGAQLIVAFSTSAARLATQVAPSLPVVFVVNDPVAAGLLHDPNRPDGEATGVTFRVPADRTLDLAQRVIGKVETVGLLYAPADPGSAPARDATLQAAEHLGISVVAQPFSGPGDIVAAVDVLAARHVQAVILANSPTAVVSAPAAAQDIMARRIPVVANTDFVQYAIAVLQPDYVALGQQTAAEVARLLSGAKPADVPVEDPRTYQTVLNEKIAGQLGITIPDPVLREATRVIR